MEKKNRILFRKQGELLSAYPEKRAISKEHSQSARTALVQKSQKAKKGLVARFGSESLVDCCGLLSSSAELHIFCCSGGDRRVTIGDFWGESSRFSVILMQLGSPAPSRRGNRSWRKSQNRPDRQRAARSPLWKSRFFRIGGDFWSGFRWGGLRLFFLFRHVQGLHSRDYLTR